ncbi:Gfo/Idh/MocA family protein [Methanospirillum lacunae]|uniref:Oxidoreductase n=1 Tax=Methanospirillum lacunae TaxID=668570 RepID=A0A2V2NB94_9EURY|nr:Gfo/Idh/MocA family oxidoreductase [Methanospirillum lacunae]PWR72841.1 oxidoreductase [Methanospirillum lacunae]
MIQVAQIGIGYWGPNILRTLRNNTECQVKYVVDISLERRTYVNNLYSNIITLESPESVFLDPDIDAVIISTPVHTHYSLAMAALHHGKHILVEKPLATSIHEVDMIHQIASEKSKVAMVGHTFLYNSAVRYIKNLINSDSLGKIRYIYSQRLNLGRIRSDVDALWNFAPHDISILQYWLNDPKPDAVFRHGMDFIQDNIEDVVFLTIRYPQKILANIHVSWLDPRKVRQITIVGSEKMVIYDDMKEDKVVIFDKGIDKKAILGENMDYDSPSSYFFSYRSGDILIPKINYEEPLMVEIQHFIDCINGKTQCISGPEHARKVVDILSRCKLV